MASEHSINDLLEDWGVGDLKQRFIGKYVEIMLSTCFKFTIELI